jgi:N-acetylneuraminic acid mutarotase
LNNPSSQGPLILLANGQVLTVGTGSAELYNPATGKWTVTASTATPRSGHTATMLPNGEVLVAGGYLGNHSSTIAMLTNGDVLIFGNHFPSYASQFYDPVANTWTPTKGQNNGQISVGPLAALSNGKVLLAGGQFKYGGFNPTCMLYDPSTNTWSLTGSLKQRGGRVTRLPNGQVLDVGPAGAELYTP